MGILQSTKMNIREIKGKEFDEIIETGNIEKLKQLDKGDLNAYLRYCGYSGLFNGVKKFPDDNKIIIEMFDILEEKDPGFLQHCDVEGYQIIITFAYEKNIEIVDYLLKKDNSINASGMYDMSVFDAAICDLDFLKFAQEKGLRICYNEDDYEIVFKENYTPISLSLSYYIYHIPFNNDKEIAKNKVKNLIEIGCHKYSENPYSKILKYTKDYYDTNKNEDLREIIEYIENKIEQTPKYKVQNYYFGQSIKKNEDSDCLIIDVRYFLNNKDAKDFGIDSDDENEMNKELNKLFDRLSYLNQDIYQKDFSQIDETKYKKLINEKLKVVILKIENEDFEKECMILYNALKEKINNEFPSIEIILRIG